MAKLQYAFWFRLVQTLSTHRDQKAMKSTKEPSQYFINQFVIEQAYTDKPVIKKNKQKNRLDLNLVFWISVTLFQRSQPPDMS